MMEPAGATKENMAVLLAVAQNPEATECIGGDVRTCAGLDTELDVSLTSRGCAKDAELQSTLHVDAAP